MDTEQYTRAQPRASKEKEIDVHSNHSFSSKPTHASNSKQGPIGNHGHTRTSSGNMNATNSRMIRKGQPQSAFSVNSD